MNTPVASPTSVQQSSTSQTIGVVKAAAELHHAQQIARSLTISSKNLRTFAMRIGQNAAGLAILASFYEEFSRNTIDLSNQVSLLTMHNAKHSVSEWRIDIFEAQLEKACRSIPTDKVPATVAAHLARKTQRVSQNNERILRFNRELQDLLLEIKKNVRSIAVIAVNSKIEAPKTGEHYGALLDVAAGVEHMTGLITEHIDKAMSYLKNSRLTRH